MSSVTADLKFLTIQRGFTRVNKKGSISNNIQNTELQGAIDFTLIGRSSDTQDDGAPLQNKSEERGSFNRLEPATWITNYHLHLFPNRLHFGFLM